MMEKGKVQFKTVFLEKTLPEDKKTDSLIGWGKKFKAIGIAPETKGNLSLRTRRGFIITGAGKALGGLKSEDLVEVIDVKKEKESFVVYCRGRVIPSMETIFHKEIYKLRPDINAIFHLHDHSVLEAEKKLKIPRTQKEQPPGSYLLVREIKKLFLGKITNYFILKNHGVVALGKTVAEAGNLVKKIHQKARR